MDKKITIENNYHNIGGRDYLATQIFNHHTAMTKMKPKMKITKPRPHVSSNLANKAKYG